MTLELFVCRLPSPAGRRVGDEGLARLLTVSTACVSRWDQVIPSAHADGTDCANSSPAKRRKLYQGSKYDFEVAPGLGFTFESSTSLASVTLSSSILIFCSTCHDRPIASWAANMSLYSPATKFCK